VSVGLRVCVREHSRATGTVRFLLYLLADYTDDRDGFAYPSLPTLKRDLKVDRRSVQRAIRSAERLGELRVEPGHGRGHFTRYYVQCGQPSLHAEKAASAPPIRSDEKAASTTEKAASASGKGGAGVAPTGKERNEAGKTTRPTRSDEWVASQRKLLADPTRPAYVRRAALKELDRAGLATDDDRAILGGTRR
jgi:hypothetical protein